MEDLKASAPLLVRFVAIEEAVKVAKEERHEMIEEIRGLRKEIGDVLKLMVNGYQSGHKP